MEAVQGHRPEGLPLRGQEDHGVLPALRVRRLAGKHGGRALGGEGPVDLRDVQGRQGQVRESAKLPLEGDASPAGLDHHAVDPACERRDRDVPADAVRAGERSAARTMILAKAQA